MPEERADLIVIEEQKQAFLNLPALGPSNMPALPSWVPRYDEVSGAVYTTRWASVATEVREEGQFLPEAERFIVVKKPRHAKKVDLEAFPKKWRVVRLIPQEVEDGIEAAMRQQDEVRHDYGAFEGIEQEQVEKVMVVLRELSEEFKNENITRARLPEIAERSVQAMKELGIVMPRGVKARIVTLVERAANPDELGRVNPMISRILLQSAYLDAVRREVLARLVREKANRIFNLLYIERAVTRDFLTDSAEAIAKMAGLGGEKGEEVLTEAFYKERGGKNIPAGDITRIRRTFKAIVVLNLRPVRVAPYLLVARLSEAMLLSPAYMMEEDQIKLKETLKYYGMEEVLEQKSAEDFMRQGNPGKVVERLRQVHSLLQACLEDPDNQVYRVF